MCHCISTFSVYTVLKQYTPFSVLSISTRLQGKYGITRLIFIFVCIGRVPIQPIQVSGIVSRCSVGELSSAQLFKAQKQKSQM